MSMAGHISCSIRLVAFAGYGMATEHGVMTIALSHCAQFIAQRLREAQDVLAGTPFPAGETDARDVGAALQRVTSLSE